MNKRLIAENPKTFEQLSLFNEVPEQISYTLEMTDKVFLFLNSKFAHYMPYPNKHGEWEIKVKGRKLTFAKRKASKYSCAEFRNGYYVVTYEYKDSGMSFPTVDFLKACNEFSDFVKKAEKNE